MPSLWALPLGRPALPGFGEPQPAGWNPESHAFSWPCLQRAQGGGAPVVSAPVPSGAGATQGPWHHPAHGGAWVQSCARRGERMAVQGPRGARERWSLWPRAGSTALPPCPRLSLQGRHVDRAAPYPSRSGGPGPWSQGSCWSGTPLRAPVLSFCWQGLPSPASLSPCLAHCSGWPAGPRVTICASVALSATSPAVLPTGTAQISERRATQGTVKTIHCGCHSQGRQSPWDTGWHHAALPARGPFPWAPTVTSGNLACGGGSPQAHSLTRETRSSEPSLVEKVGITVNDFRGDVTSQVNRIREVTGRQ